MDRSKLMLKLIIPIAVVLIILGFLPGVQGTANIRPIDDWVKPPTNAYDPLVNNGNVFSYWDYENYLATFPHGIPWWTLPLWGFEEYIWDCEYSGFVLEKVLNNGDLEYLIDLHVKDAWFAIRYWWDIPDIIITGCIDYHYQLKFILKSDYSGGTGSFDFAFKTFYYDIPIGNREPGNELPSLLFLWAIEENAIPNVIGSHMISEHFIGSGIGEFTDFAANYGFTPGAKVEVNIHALISFYDEGYISQPSFIKFHEIG